ncbi:MAG: Fic family protein [Leptospiraceae bacterium]|nr:Fic family protein [Leptospiraceae bacterium]
MEQEVRNVLDALNSIRDQIVNGVLIELISPQLIKRFHFLIGKDLNKNFEAIPGEFRRNEVTVGAVYKAPPYVEVEEFMRRFCDWVRKEFHYEKGQSFSTAILQAIVTHVYIAWIHPFGDGNGRTARLIEFYLLLRAGIPDIAAHVLSNFYNETRADYYRHLRESSQGGGDLSNFIKYAIQGFKDGLKSILEKVNLNQLEIAWRNHVHETFQSAVAPRTTQIKKRQMGLILSMNLEFDYTEDRLMRLNNSIELEYAEKSRRTFTRDLQSLIAMGLVVNSESGYRANTAILRGAMAQVRIDKLSF